MTEPKVAPVPQVYNAIAAVLNALSVEKGGQLPSNMGGKPYITATDLNNEVKRQFVENNLILLPSEHELKHDVIQFKERLNVAVSIEGTYTIVSTEDGSSVVVQGVGDGLASGTAVASNIASTNALKNALLRTFLVTEQSVEDQAKNGTGGDDREPTKAEQRVEQGRNTPNPATGAGVVDPQIKALQDQIKAATIARQEVEPDFPVYTQFASKYLGADALGWSKSVEKLTRVLAAIKGGEAA